MLISLINSREASGNFGNRRFAVTHLLARFSELARNRILHARIIKIDFTIHCFIHMIDFILRALIFFVNFIVETTREIADLTHHDNNCC